MSKNITFVDENDNIIGSGTKKQAWENGNIHRIARLFVFNSKGELLIHKRSDKLKNLPGRWDQSASGHVDEGEDYLAAAERELEEEMGIKGVELEEVGKFYQDEVDDDGKIKKRFNMLYKARHDGEVNFSKGEVSEIKWVNINDLRRQMKEKPKDFTQGFIDSVEL
ncbi:MAG: Dimethyladenosine transferase, partial [Microgenomates group bacterium GW2011_GWA1_Microgenomates_45_10]